MDAYLVPIGAGRYELYCEPGDESPAAEVPHHPGMWKRWTDKFGAVIAAVEREQEEHARDHATAEAPASWSRRLRKRVLAWVAEKIAEQRLLWRLRGRTEVRVFYPEGLSADVALSTVRGTLVREFDRHRWWMALDLLGGLFSLALVPLPGPNVVGLYFTFRIVGHFFALRGARQGLTAVRWDLQPNAVLASLAKGAGLPVEQREECVQRAADELGLPRLPRFYRRVGPGTA